MPRNRHARESLLALHLLGAATVLVACQEEALWNDKSFDKLVSSDAAIPYESAEPAPQPPPTQVSKAPFGEEPKDLTFLICFALENNPSTRATWERAKVTAANWAMMESLWWPRVNATGFGGYRQEALPQETGRLLDRGPQGDLGVELTWELVDFGRRDALTDAARRAMEASNLTFNRALQTLVYDVQTAYFQLDSKIALEETAEQNVETARVQMEAVEDRLRVGLAIMPDVLVSRQRWEQARFTLESARSATFDARSTLARKLGLSADVPVEILSLQKLPVPESLGKKVEQLMALGATDRPDLLAAGQRVREAEARIRKAEADFMPTVSMVGAVMNKWYNYTPDPAPANASYDTTLPTYAVGLTGSWLLFDGFERVNAVRKARSERNAAVADLTKLKLEALSDVWKAYFEQLAAERQFTYGESLLTASQDSYDAMFEAYVNGLRTLPELLQAELDLAAARSTLIRTRAELLDSAARLAYAVGSPDFAGRYAKKVDPRTDGERVR
jgi:outer membrane protein